MIDPEPKLYSAAEIIRAHQEFVASEKKRLLTALDKTHSRGERTDENTTGECLECGDGRSGTPCVHRGYSARQRRFIMVPHHLEAFRAAFYNPDKRSASNELARLAREFQTLPPRHDCWCWCPREDGSRGYPACAECLRLRRDQKPQEAPEFGRTAAVNAPMPDTTLLDLAAGLLAA